MRKRTVLLSVAAVLCSAGSLYAWFAMGHQKATSFALTALPREMPAFFRENASLIDSACLDPDIFTRPAAPPQLHDVEALQHYFDIEMLPARPLPLTRYEFLEQCYRSKLQPSKVGLLPYAVVECTQRLSVCFALYRRHPEDKNIQAKCLVYAGLLAHYAEDLCQPLHSTIDYDGRHRPDGSSPRTGIHAKVDSILWGPARKEVLLRHMAAKVLTKAAPPAAETATTGPATPEQVQARRKAEAQRARELLDAVMAELENSHSLVEKVYQLEKDLPADRLAPLSPEVEEFADEQLARTAHFTASLFLTAWQDSLYTEFPKWQKGESY